MSNYGNYISDFVDLKAMQRATDCFINKLENIKKKYPGNEDIKHLPVHIRVMLWLHLKIYFYKLKRAIK